MEHCLGEYLAEYLASGKAEMTEEMMDDSKVCGLDEQRAEWKDCQMVS